MQMLSDLDQIMETLWLAICTAAAFLIAGMAFHAAIRLALRARSAPNRRRRGTPGPSAKSSGLTCYAVVSTLVPAAPADDPLATVTMAGRSRRP